MCSVRARVSIGIVSGEIHKFTAILQEEGEMVQAQVELRTILGFNFVLSIWRNS